MNRILGPLGRHAAAHPWRTILLWVVAAASVFALAGCSGLARCDFFVAPDGSVLVNEINTMPGFTDTSVYVKLFEASGTAYPQLCDRLVQLAVERHRQARSYRF